jgi:hypothetical protein
MSRPAEHDATQDFPHGTPSKQHGDPLLDAAQGRGDGEDASRHGHDAGRPADSSTGHSGDGVAGQR